MAKRKEDLKKIVSISISPQQHKDLIELAEYAGLSLSEVVRELLPSTEELAAWQAYQDFCDILGESHREKVLNKMTKTSRLFMEMVMSNHFQAPIGLQVKAVSYFDKTGADIYKLFKNWINALRSFGGCRFEKEKFKYPSNTYIYYVCLAPGESKKNVDALVGKYCTLAPDAEVNDAIKQSARVKAKKKKAKRIKQKKLKTKKK